MHTMSAVLKACWGESAGLTSMLSDADISLAKVLARAGSRSKTKAFLMALTAQTARSWVRAWTPAPKIATVEASCLASRSVARPDAAPVLSEVRVAASRMASGEPFVPSKRQTMPWMKGRC